MSIFKKNKAPCTYRRKKFTVMAYISFFSIASLILTYLFINDITHHYPSLSKIELISYIASLIISLTLLKKNILKLQIIISQKKQHLDLHFLHAIHQIQPASTLTNLPTNITSPFAEEVSALPFSVSQPLSPNAELSNYNLNHLHTSSNDIKL